MTDPLSTVTKRLRAGIKPQTTGRHDFLIAAIRGSSLRCHRATRLNVSAEYISGQHKTPSDGYRAIDPTYELADDRSGFRSVCLWTVRTESEA